MDIQRWTDQETWDAFVRGQPHTPFQQTWAWGEFQHHVGVEILRWAVVVGNRIVAVAQVLHQPWRFGQSTFTGFHAPLVDSQLPVAQYHQAFALTLRALADATRTSSAMSLHLEPPVVMSDVALLKIFHEASFRPAPAFQPLDTLVLDLQQPMESLLAAMHEKTRYNLRLAERKGVRIEVASGHQTKAVDTFIQLNRQTAKRDRFQSHGPAYYRRLAEHLPVDALRVYVAYFHDQPIAANIVVHAGDTATYVHGASGNAHRNVMAPHLLQWRQILDAQLAGKRWYDFFGIETQGRPRTSRQGASWAGITRFKLGFGGTPLAYAPAHELIVRRGWYRLVRAVRLLRH